MIDDFRHLEEGTILQADVCVIGTGAAGISIAREFFGTNIQVLLLEGGGTAPEPETQALYEVECVGLPFPGRSMAGRGSSAARPRYGAARPFHSAKPISTSVPGFPTAGGRSRWQI